MTDIAADRRRLSPRTKAGLGFFARYATIIGLLAMIALFSVLSPRAFPTLLNFTNVVNQASLAIIIASGLTLAVIVGELDLSIGFAASLHGILVTGLIVGSGLPIPVAILLVLAAGALVGLVNGLVVTKLKVNSVIATLGVGTILTGLAFAYSAGVPIVAGVPEAFLDIALGRWLWGIPNTIIIMAAIVLALWVLVERTAIGQEIQAVGGNPVAARLAGISVDRIKILGFVISGTLAALTGILLASRLGSGTASAADSYLLTAFAAVFLGSATLRDGEFHILGTVIGALIIAFAFNGLNIFGAPTFSQYIVQGAILIVAVGLSSLGRSLAERWSMIWDVHVIEYARSKDQLVAGIIHGAHDGTVVDLPFAFVLARAAGHVVLIDTGFIREGSGAAFADRFGIPSWISPVRMLEALGVAADDVTDIVVSHAHFDHMGGIGAFPRARIHIQKREYLSTMELLALPRQFGALTEIINPDDVRTAFDAALEHRLNLVDGDRDNLLPGLHARFGPGHTLGQQFVVLETGRGGVVVAGDCIYSKRNLCGHGNSGVYAPLANAIGSTWDQLIAMDRINETVGGDLTRLIILHDADRWPHLSPVAEVDGFGIFRV